MIETHSSTWETVTRYAEQQISEAHQTLEGVLVDERVADTQRGRILALREVLKLAEPPIPRVSVNDFLNED